MAITLEELKVGMADKVDQQVIDTFIRKSEILELLTFDDAVSPNGGSTLTYGYVQTKKPSSASFRAINTEYTPNSATVQSKSVALKIFGGAFQIDRIIKDAEGKLNNMQFQLEQKIQGAVELFNYTIINGDVAKNSDSFDGLNAMLVGTETEFNTDSFIDLSTIAKLKDNADEFYEALLKLINRTNADALLVNEDTKTKIQTVARVLGYKTESEEAFGRVITTIGENGVRIIDMKNYYGGSEDNTVIIPSVTRTIDTVEVSGLSDIYAVRFDVNDAFLGVTLSGNSAITSYLPDFTTTGAVKDCEVEMVGAVALKNTRGAGVLRNIKLI